MGEPLTYAELFAGAGGLSYGLEMAGWESVGHAEIEPHARAILRRHWPDIPLHGDVSQLHGSVFKGATLLSGGSPCQDLSIAGKRAGMVEGSGTRSALYFEQVRIWQESGAPYFLWENVLGALSSNAGNDFAAVLSALVGATVVVPADGWRGAGVARGATGVAAWRVLDAQYFGVPQRRRRVFVLCARTGGVDPAEVLSLGEGVRGDTPQSREAGEGTAGDAGAGIAATFDPVNVTSKVNRTKVELGRPAQTIHGRGMHVLTYDARGNGDGSVANTLAGDHQNRVTDYTAIVLRNREGKPGGGKGPLLSAERERTLGTTNDQVVFTTGGHADFVKAEAVSSLRANGGDIGGGSEALVFTKRQYGSYEDAPSVASTLGARDHAALNVDIAVGAGRPRRLMPVECERLMGWGDAHTAFGVNEKGVRYALADTPRYKLCGNGVASPVAAWIGWRLREALIAPLDSPLDRY